MQLSEPMMAYILLTHICVARPRWSKTLLTPSYKAPYLRPLKFDVTSIHLNQLQARCRCWWWAPGRHWPNLKDVTKWTTSASARESGCESMCPVRMRCDINSSPLDKMAVISQTIFSDAFLWVKSFAFWSKFHWSLFLRVQLTISQHWFR